VGELIVQDDGEALQRCIPCLQIGYIGVEADKHFSAQQVELDVIVQIVTVGRKS
jgi:hypothetical protein